MNRARTTTLATAAAFAALAVGLVMAREGPPPRVAPAKAGTAKEPVAPEKGREADREAILKAGEAFSKAFAQGDAKAIAALWTENAEFIGEGGTVEGRADIEKAFTELFQDKTRATLEIDARSVRFPAADMAIEEGFLRHVPEGPGLPSSTRYLTVFAREDGKWRIASSREYGGGQDRLGDLAWLIGKWDGGPKGQEVGLAFEKDTTGPFILGKFTRNSNGKVVATGTLKIGMDGQRDQIRSWHFDNDGGHGQCLWVRDGNRWVLDATGARADGAETGAVNVLARLNNDEITWRSIDRVVAGEPLPDTVPVKLTRVRERK